jgi:hypothetical protein
MKFSRKVLIAALESVLDPDGYKTAVFFVPNDANPKGKIKATLRHRPRRNDRQTEVILTLGALSNEERKYAKKFLRREFFIPPRMIDFPKRRAKVKKAPTGK